MKKYSVYSLDVVKVGTGNEAHYFICKQKYDSNIYVEVFTKQKIVVEDETNVEPLCDWYPLAAQFNFSTGEVLMLTKKQLLIQYIEINNYYTKKRIEEKNKINIKIKK